MSTLLKRVGIALVLLALMALGWVGYEAVGWELMQQGFPGCA